MEYTDLFKKEQFNKFKIEIQKYNNYRCYGKSVVILRDSIICFPKHSGLYYLLAITYFNSGEYLKAIDNFKKGISYDKKDNEYLALLGCCFFAVNDIENSYNYAYKAFKINRNDVDAVIVLGNIEFLKNNYEDSLSYACTAIEIDQDNFEAMKLLGKIYVSIGADYNETLDILYKTKQLGQDDEVYLNIIKLHYINENFKSCLKECKYVLLNYRDSYISEKVMITINRISKRFTNSNSQIDDDEEKLKETDKDIKGNNSYMYAFKDTIIKKIDKIIDTIDITNDTEDDKSIDNLELKNQNYIEINQDVKIDEETECMSTALEKLESLVGLENVKKQVEKIIRFVKYQKSRSDILKIKNDIVNSYHFLFLGNPGTGKTTVARLIGDIFFDLGILEKGHLVEVDRSDIVGKFVGETAKLTKKFIDKAMGGILFIDEAYSLAKGGKDSNDYGKEAIEILLKSMEDNRGKFTVILAGYTKEMTNLMKLNPGLKSRINVEVNFNDYKQEELLSIAENIASENKYELTEDAKEAFCELIDTKKIEENFANARCVRNILEEAMRERAYRIGDNQVSKQELLILTSEDFGVNLEFTAKNDVKKTEQKLNDLVGLTGVKNILNNILNTIEFQYRRKQLGLENDIMSLNMIFSGNPGTGKTTVARILGEYLKNIGVLKKGQLIEATRSDLVGQYVGETAIKTSEKIKEAYGGILFIDEAYSLDVRSQNDFGKEAIATLIKEMEDNRDKLIVIMAGYTNEMKELLDVNPGLESRIKFNVQFDDYSKFELIQIFKNLCKKEKYTISKNANKKLNKLFDDAVKNKDKNFGNARLVRSVFEKVKMQQANRIIKFNIFDENEMLKIISSDTVIS